MVVPSVLTSVEDLRVGLGERHRPSVGASVGPLLIQQIYRQPRPPALLVYPVLDQPQFIP
jgi:hypothetical protein